MNRRAAFASLLAWLSGLLAPSSTPPAHAAESPWASLLEADVETMHRVLLENHPGAVDALYRNRPRGNNQPYVPHHAWKGSMADTAALEKWILSLPVAPRER